MSQGDFYVQFEFSPEMPTLLVIDTSYSLEAIRQRQLESSVLSRSLDGFFPEVWSVHPLASLVTSPEWGSRYGHPKLYRVLGRNFFIEGRVGLSRLLRFFPPLNLLLVQAHLFVVLLRVIKRREVKVIRVGDPLYSGLLGYFLSKVTGLPFLVRVGSNNDAIFKATKRPMMPRLFIFRRFEKLVERIVLSNADMVIAANENNRQFAISSGASSGRAEVIRYGNLLHPCHLECPLSRPRALDDFPAERFPTGSFLLYIGRFEPVKHADHVILLLARIVGAGIPLKAVLCGDGSIRDQLEALADSLGVREFVYFAGNRNQEWLARIIPQAAIVVSPHTGRALCEAAFGAAPVIAYDIDWQGELIVDGVTGRLVPYLDLDAFEKACRSLLEDKTCAGLLGINLREAALEMLDPKKISEQERLCYLRAMRGCSDTKVISG